MYGLERQNLRHQGERYWLWFKRQPGYWLRLIPQAVKETFNENTSLFAASLGYYTFISLFPLLLLSVALGSLWFDPLWAEGKITAQLDAVIPGLSEMLGQNIESIVSARGPMSGLALILLMWAASNIFNVLVYSMDNVWGMAKGRNGWQRRGLALLLVMIFSGLLLIGSTIEGFVVTVINSFLRDELRILRPYTNQLWAALVSIALFAVLYRVLPHKKLSWRDVLPGAVVAALVWELLKRAFLVFIDIYLTRSNLVYGSVTTVIAFLTWTWASGIIFLYGAHLNVVYYKSRQALKQDNDAEES